MTHGRCPVMSDTPPDDADRGALPERELQRLSGTAAISPWLIVGLIPMLGALVYVVSAVL